MQLEDFAVLQVPAGHSIPGPSAEEEWENVLMKNPLRCDQSKSQGVTNSKDMAMVMAQNPGARMVPQVIAGEWMLIPPGFDPSQKCQGARSIWAWCIPSPDDSYGNGWNWQR